MKRKNNCAWLCILWILIALCDMICCILNFIEGKLFLGAICLILSVSFSFVGGILLEKAISIYWQNKEVDYLNELFEEYREQKSEQIKPFEEFENQKESYNDKEVFEPVERN
jgi:hypothetical protein